MAIGLSVSGDAFTGFQLTVTNADEADRFHIIRTDASGHYEVVPVRGGDYAAPTGSTMIIDDFEAPFNTTLSYTAQAFDLQDLETPVSEDTQGPFITEVPLGYFLIHHVLNPDYRIVGAIELNDWNIKSKVLSRVEVLGRSKPIVTTDLMGGREGEMSLTNVHVFSVDYGLGDPDIHETYSDAALNNIFKDGDTLLFRSSWEETGFDDMYFKVDGLTYRRRGIVRNDSPILTLNIKYIEVDKPPTALNSLTLLTWGDLNDNNVDWDEVNSTHADWESVADNPLL